MPDQIEHMKRQLNIKPSETNFNDHQRFKEAKQLLLSFDSEKKTLRLEFAICHTICDTVNRHTHTNTHAHTESEMTINGEKSHILCHFIGYLHNHDAQRIFRFACTNECARLTSWIEPQAKCCHFLSKRNYYYRLCENEHFSVEYIVLGSKGGCFWLYLWLNNSHNAFSIQRYLCARRTVWIFAKPNNNSNNKTR